MLFESIRGYFSFIGVFLSYLILGPRINIDNKQLVIAIFWFELDFSLKTA